MTGEQRTRQDGWPPAVVARAFAVTLLFAWVAAVHAAEPCTPAFARVVSVQGNVELRRTGANWQAAELNSTLCAGDMVRVHQRSRAALLLSNETTLRLDQGTALTLLAPDDRKATLLELISGGLLAITRTPRPFRIKTPFVNANVEGTEFAVRVDDNNARIAVYEGQVVAENDVGSVALASGETAVATRNAAPTKAIVIRPTDAVAWTLYFPTVFDYRLDAGVAGSPGEAARQRSVELYRKGQIVQALAELEQDRSAAADPRSLTYRAGLLLLVGRLDEARPELEKALRTDANHSDAYALLAIVALVENDKDRTLELARRAVNLDVKSPAAHIALSYAQQARFDIDAALASVREAGQLDPGSALALARQAELEMSVGNLNGALTSAQEAVRLNPNLSKTQTVLGFANLLRIDTAAAKESFGRAIDLDAADPLPRLGLGLAKIREGNLEAGRTEIEIAAILDPRNSLVRSYLGKAYYEEKRDGLAGVQYGLAMEQDPKDPTPYFYNAVRMQAGNQPVEALQELNKSLALNDNRAVYRSRLLLDQDRAARQANLASIFSELGSEREAIAIASDSLNDDPSNYSAHRFLSEAYARRDRHDIARTSELLQAQLLQPLSLNPTAPDLPFTDIGVPSAASQAAVFSNEYSAMFERDRIQASLGALTGNLGTTGGVALLSGLRGPLSGSVGYFEYSTNGFRPNSDISHRISNAFFQFAATPFLSLQAEYRERHTDRGDIALSFDPTFFAPLDRQKIRQHSARAGATYRPSADSLFIASVVQNRARFDDRLATEGVFDGTLLTEDSAHLYELQYQSRWGGANIVAGLGRSVVDESRQLHLDFTPVFGVPCDPSVEPCDSSEMVQKKQWNGYFYAHMRPLARLDLSLGLSRDSFADGRIDIKKWNPKLGLRAQLTSDTAFRLATFGTVKRALVTQQTIEPTQVMGFNQLYDDVVGSVNRFHLAALDTHVSLSTTVGLEAGRQTSKVSTGTVGPTFEPIPTQTLRTKWIRLDLNSRLSSRIAASAAMSREHFDWDATILTDAPTYLRTTKLPLAMRVLLPRGWFGEVGVTTVWQSVRRLPGFGPEGEERFSVVDLSLGYRLPQRLGTVSLDIKNLFATKFSHQDDNFRSTETRLSPYLPLRRAWLRASLAF